MGSVEGKTSCTCMGYGAECRPRTATFGFHEKKRKKRDKQTNPDVYPLGMWYNMTGRFDLSSSEARAEAHSRVPFLTHDLMISWCGVIGRSSELNLAPPV